ncbi:MAG: dienelactone hydrolase family protein [Rhodospirillales bacterium]|nr:dienelactone hydrolase family protein [Rhodospirillales bacterium]
MHQDVLSLMPKADISRRSFVTGATAIAGFAIAAGPVNAQTVVTTDTGGLIAGMGQVPVAGGMMPAYYAMPANGGPFPTVLVVQEIFGVHEHIKDVCRRLGKLGYMAVAPELYFRQGDPSKLPDVPTIFKEIVSKVADAQVMADLDSTAAWAIAQKSANPDKFAVTGFCWGGRITWLYSAHSPRVKAGVAWYGRLVGDKNAMTPRQPVDIAAELKAPVLGLYGAADQGIPVATVDQMKAALKAAKVATDWVVYPDAPHAFHADYRPTYREGPAKDGWKKMQEWFKKHGV